MVLAKVVIRVDYFELPVIDPGAICVPEAGHTLWRPQTQVGIAVEGFANGEGPSVGFPS